MDRNPLEDRIRESLQARADDVRATPQLWEQVAERANRRSRRLWAARLGQIASGLAVGAIVAFGVVQLTSSPQSVTIDPAGPAPSDSASPTPEPSATVDPSPEPTVEPTGPPTAADAPRVVATDGRLLFEVDPATGLAIRDLRMLDGAPEGTVIGSVAVRPDAGDDLLTAAITIAADGNAWEVQIISWDRDGAIDGSYRVPQVIADAGEPAPTVTWSEDGTFVAWTTRAGADADDLVLFDWADHAVSGSQRAVSYSLPADLTAPQDVASWRGKALDGPSAVSLVGPQGITRANLDAPDPDNCPFPGEDCSREPRLIGFEPFAFEGGAPVAVGVLGNGIEVALVARAGTTQDAEGATLVFVADPMSDTQRTLELPKLTEGTASPLDAWMTVEGEWITAGFGDRTFLARITGDTVENLTVAAVVDLPPDTTAAGPR